MPSLLCNLNSQSRLTCIKIFIFNNSVPVRLNGVICNTICSYSHDTQEIIIYSSHFQFQFWIHSRHHKPNSAPQIHLIVIYLVRGNPDHSNEVRLTNVRVHLPAITFIAFVLVAFILLKEKNKKKPKLCSKE